MSQIDLVSSFVEGAPPGEVSRPSIAGPRHQAHANRMDHSSQTSLPVECPPKPRHDWPVDAWLADIKALTSSDIVADLKPAFQKYNEEQFLTVKLPGSSEPVGCRQRHHRGVFLLIQFADR